ncbi:MAG: Fic family protein, partial [Bacteroidota bacterium]
FQEVPTLMYQFLDDLKFQLSRSGGEEDLITVIAFAHHQFVKIHPFNNGNGRTARLISDFIAFSNGYDEIVLYHRDGDERKMYLEAIRAADNLDYSVLEGMIRSQLKPLL